MGDGSDRLIGTPTGSLRIPDDLSTPSEGEPVFLAEETVDGVILTFGTAGSGGSEGDDVVVASSRLSFSRDGFDRLVTQLEMVRAALDDPRP